MHTSGHGIYLIESFEGFSSVQYDDGVGVMTIGYGTTAADISPLPRSCTREQAEQWLRTKLQQKYEPAVNALNVPLNRNQFDALVSLAYNCGPGSMQWQIGRDLRARNYRAAADDFLHYVYAGGRILQGLVNRRRSERALFLTPVNPPRPAPPPQPPRTYNQAFQIGYNRGFNVVWLRSHRLAVPPFRVPIPTNLKPAFNTGFRRGFNTAWRKL